jgi:hypothetical protein
MESSKFVFSTLLRIHGDLKSCLAFIAKFHTLISRCRQISSWSFHPKSRLQWGIIPIFTPLQPAFIVTTCNITRSYKISTRSLIPTWPASLCFSRQASIRFTWSSSQTNLEARHSYPDSSILILTKHLAQRHHSLLYFLSSNRVF